MPLEELRRQGLLLPEEHWGRTPETTLRSRLSVIITFSIGLAAAWMIWAGAGGWLTFVGTGVFLIDLVLILWTTFSVVDVRVDHLEEMDLEGEVEGLGGPAPER